MLFRLALEMNEPDVDAFASRLTMRSLAMWQGFYDVEPFGDEWRQSMRLANMIRAMAGADVKVEDEDKLMPNYRPPVQTEAEMIAELAKIPAFAEQLRAAGKIGGDA
jgi:hypothetical protein